MCEVFRELYLITKREVMLHLSRRNRRGKVKLDEHIVPLGIKAGFKYLGVVINLQEFTKTANIWGVSNNTFGTNTNRIVLFRKA